jgi:Domain of unknown function (DU1801)
MASSSAPKSNITPFARPEVAAVFDAYPARVRKKMLALRELIFQVAADTEGVGLLEETLKWGEPAYLTSVSKSGSTVRIDWKPARPDHYAMYFHCQTQLVDTFRTLFPAEFSFDGNRALVFGIDDALPWDALAVCVRASLTYRLSQKRKASPPPRAHRNTP